MRRPPISLILAVCLMSCLDIIAQNVSDLNSFKQANAEHIQADFEVMNGLQLIYKNTIKWLTVDGKLHDKKPKPSYGLCGTVGYANRVIQKQEDGLYEVLTRGHYGYADGAETAQNNLIWSRTDIKNLSYLNGTPEHSYTGNSGIFAVYHLPYDYYVFETAKTKGIVQIANTAASQESEKTKAQVQQKILLEADFQEIESFGYNHPIRFKKDDLYGYFPMNETAKYKSLEPYNQHFAAFEYPDGRKGWIDLEGKEYFVVK